MGVNPCGNKGQSHHHSSNAGGASTSSASAASLRRQQQLLQHRYQQHQAAIALAQAAGQGGIPNNYSPHAPSMNQGNRAASTSGHTVGRTQRMAVQQSSPSVGGAHMVSRAATPTDQFRMRQHQAVPYARSQSYARSHAVSPMPVMRSHSPARTAPNAMRSHSPLRHQSPSRSHSPFRSQQPRQAPSPMGLRGRTPTNRPFAASPVHHLAQNMSAPSPSSGPVHRGRSFSERFGRGRSRSKSRERTPGHVPGRPRSLSRNQSESSRCGDNGYDYEEHMAREAAIMGVHHSTSLFTSHMNAHSHGRIQSGRTTDDVLFGNRQNTRGMSPLTRSRSKSPTKARVPMIDVTGRFSKHSSPSPMPRTRSAVGYMGHPSPHHTSTKGHHLISSRGMVQSNVNDDFMVKNGSGYPQQLVQQNQQQPHQHRMPLQQQQHSNPGPDFDFMMAQPQDKSAHSQGAIFPFTRQTVDQEEQENAYNRRHSIYPGLDGKVSNEFDHSLNESPPHFSDSSSESARMRATIAVAAAEKQHLRQNQPSEKPQTSQPSRMQFLASDEKPISSSAEGDDAGRGPRRNPSLAVDVGSNEIGSEGVRSHHGNVLGKDCGSPISVEVADRYGTVDCLQESDSFGLDAQDTPEQPSRDTQLVPESEFRRCPPEGDSTAYKQSNERYDQASDDSREKYIAEANRLANERSVSPYKHFVDDTGKSCDRKEMKHDHLNPAPHDNPKENTRSTTPIRGLKPKKSGLSKIFGKLRGGRDKKQHANAQSMRADADLASRGANAYSAVEDDEIPLVQKSNERDSDQREPNLTTEKPQSSRWFRRNDAESAASISAYGTEASSARSGKGSSLFGRRKSKMTTPPLSEASESTLSSGHPDSRSEASPADHMDPAASYDAVSYDVATGNGAVSLPSVEFGIVEVGEDEDTVTTHAIVVNKTEIEHRLTCAAVESGRTSSQTSHGVPAYSLQSINELLAETNSDLLAAKDDANIDNVELTISFIDQIKKLQEQRRPNQPPPQSGYIF